MLLIAAEKGDSIAVSSLLQAGANPDAQTNYKVVWFALHGSSPHTQMDNHKSALMAASEKGSLDIVRLLLNAGASPNLTTRIGKTALMYASEIGSLSTMELLLAAGADANAVTNEKAVWGGGDFGGSPLRYTLIHATRRKGDLQAFNLIAGHLQSRGVRLPAGEDLNCLYYAAQTGNREVTEQVLSLGVDIKLPSILILVMPSSDIRILELLLIKGANANAIEKRGRDWDTPLMAAARRGDVGIADLLISHGARIDVRGGFSETALFHAVNSNKPGMVKYLLDKGADANASWDAMPLWQGSRGTALDVAKREKNPEIILLLEKHLQNKKR